jgi:hypothetical protein
MAFMNTVNSAIPAVCLWLYSVDQIDKLIHKQGQLNSDVGRIGFSTKLIILQLP